MDRRRRGHWHHVNRWWVEYTGLSGQGRGFGFEEPLHPEGVAPTVAHWRRTVERGENHGVGYRMRVLTPGPAPLVSAPGGAGAGRAGRWGSLGRQLHRHQGADALRALGLTVEARDREMQGHSDRVTAQAAQLR